MVEEKPKSLPPIDPDRMDPNAQLTLAGFSEEQAGIGWAPLARCLEKIGPAELPSRVATAQRVLREQGVTCHVPGVSPGVGADRPWDLDILPLPIPAAEWGGIEAGLIQRARLLNRLLADLYGSQYTLREGWLPAPLIYANPSYLRPCQAVKVPGGNYLPLYAADLARSRDGRWQVLADRTQNPAGLGFMLENRALVSRVLPEAVQMAAPRSLDATLPLLRETLRRLAPRGCEGGVTVVFTPGPRNEAYFEHTFLARKLCCTLAEGGDLTVRDGRVYLKTLEGLRRVAVILRRVNDAYCDPLELRGDSLLGVPGLLEAVRTGNVTPVNALGCGLVESPGFFAFLPELCRRLLDEELLLPSVATWWCGSGEALREVRSRQNSLVVRPAWPLAGASARGDSPEAERRLQAAPQEYIGQEEVLLSQTPVLRHDGRQSMEPFYLRVFLVGDGSAYRVIPGGLVRLPGCGTLASGMFPLAQRSKDVWVVPDRPGEAAEPELKPEPAVEPVHGRGPIDLPSRVADNLFWLGRYAERLEATARIHRCILGWSLETGGASRLSLLDAMCWRMAVPPPGGTVLEDLIGRIHLAAFAVRDQLSADTWRLLNRLPEHGQRLPSAPMDALELLNTLVLDLAAFSGMEMENMTRGHGWLFLDAGRRLERAGNLLSLIGSVAVAPVGMDLLYEPMLEICDSVITFRRRYFTAIRLEDALELLLFLRDNPRSLAFQIEALERIAAALPQEPDPAGVAGIRRRISALGAAVRGGRLRSGACGPELDGKPLQPALAAYSGQIREISDLLTQTYFSHSTPRVS